MYLFAADQLINVFSNINFIRREKRQEWFKQTAGYFFMDIKSKSEKQLDQLLP